MFAYSDTADLFVNFSEEIRKTSLQLDGYLISGYIRSSKVMSARVVRVNISENSLDDIR